MPLMDPIKIEKKVSPENCTTMEKRYSPSVEPWKSP